MKSNSTSCLDFITTLINLIDLFIHAIQNIVNHHAQLLFLIIEIDLNLALFGYETHLQKYQDNEQKFRLSYHILQF